MPEFKSWRSFWDFKAMTTWGRRYVRDRETEDFLKAVLETANKHAEIVPAGTLLWRAQLGCEESHDQNTGRVSRRPYGDARMRPLPDRAIEGRANPKGIPVLYLATDHETAIAEVRPWIDSYVSVAAFKTGRELRLVSCRTDKSKLILYGLVGDKVSPHSYEECVWVHLGWAFSEPVTRSDNVADYASTQIIAELFKAHGYDGITYRSSLDTNGQNAALFDPDIVLLGERRLYRVKSVKYESEEA
jgi:hypothetical protein